MAEINTCPKKFLIKKSFVHSQKVIKNSIVDCFRKRAYLRNVTIILPRSWGTGPPDIAYRISSESADSQSMPQIWIKNTSPR